MPENFFEIENVSFTAGGKNKVNNVNLSIENEGDIICLLGPSGIGKTTILRTIAGLEKIKSGQIKLKNKILSSKDKHIEPEYRNIALSFQENSLFPHFNVEKNIELGSNRKIGKKKKINQKDVIKFLNVPQDWLNKLFDKHFSEDEINKIKSLGSFEKLMETLKKRLEEQKKRHQGGNKWIGTSGTSPFGAYGYNPEGVRIGQESSRHRKAIKVWDKRVFKDFDDRRELDSRGFQVSLKR